MEQDASSSTRSALVLDQSTQEGFVEVRNKLDSVYNDVLKRSPESAIVQEFSLILIEPRARNIQVPPTAIDIGNADVTSSLHHLQSIALDINKIST